MAWLKAETTLAFYSSETHLTSLAPHQGSCATDLFDFRRRIAVRADWIEQPNVRRNGISEVKRIRTQGDLYYIRTQVGHRHYSLRHPRWAGPRRSEKPRPSRTAIDWASWLR